MCQIILHPSKKHLAYFNYESENHLIFYRKTGVIKKILVSALNQLKSMMSYYSKVTLVLLQLHQIVPSHNNKSITALMSRLKAKLQEHYKCRVGFIWVREQCSSDTPHYHVVVMLNGQKCQSSTLVDFLTKVVWQKIHPENFSFRIRNRIYRVRKNDINELRAARLRLSYMAKSDSKTQFHSYTKRFGCSRLHPKIQK